MDVAVGEVELERGLGETVAEIREGSYKARSIVENGDGAGASRGRGLVGAGVVLGAASDGDVLEDQALAGGRKRRRDCGCVSVMFGRIEVLAPTLWKDGLAKVAGGCRCRHTALLDLGRQQGEVLGDAVDALGLDNFHVDIGEGRRGEDRGAEHREEESRGAHFRGVIELGVRSVGECWESSVARVEKSRPRSREPRIIPRPKGDEDGKGKGKETGPEGGSEGVRCPIYVWRFGWDMGEETVGGGR